MSNLKFFTKGKDELISFRKCSHTHPGNSDLKGRILVIDALTPAPDKDSGSADLYNFFKIFLDLGFHVTFIPKNLLYCGKHTDSLNRLGVECIHKPVFKSLTKAIKYHASLSNFVLIYRASIAASLVDIVRKHAPQAKLLFDVVDLHYLRKKREAGISKSPVKFFAAKRMQKIELDVIRKVDATILLSTYEIKLVRKLIPGANLFHIPVAREIQGPSNFPWEKRRDIVFIGSYKHPPNVDAVFFFTCEVWPILRSSGFAGRFIIAGSDMPAKISSLAADDIIIRGYVPDLLELFGSCRYSVAPLRYGAGMKGKVISSLSYGVPCIATSIAVEGTGLIAGEHIIVEDDPRKLAGIIQQVYDDQSVWERLSEAGLNYCIENCSIESVKKKIELMLWKLSECQGALHH